MEKRTLVLTTPVALALMLAGCAGTEPEAVEQTESAILEELVDSLPNNFPLLGPGGFSSSYSTQGLISFTGAYHQEQGSNGRECGNCHFPTSAWSVRPGDMQLLFFLSGGTHPVFNPLDANNPTADVSTMAARRTAYSQVLEHGLFRRGAAPPATREWDVIAADDPYGFGSASFIAVFRRPLISANLALAGSVGWDGRPNVPGDLRTSLTRQANGVINGAFQATTPATPAVLGEIADYQLALFSAQTHASGVSLTSCGARGGPEHLASQALVSGRFDLFDAWINLRPGSCTTKAADRRRAQIARGQELFNNKTRPGGGTCRGCHNVANNGSNLAGGMFDVGVSGPEFRDGLQLYTLQNRVTGEVRQTTDPGRSLVTGAWADLNRFKTPSLRGLAARAPYFHNGVAEDLRDVVRTYETTLGFDFTSQEEDDLVAFLGAL